MDGCLRGKSVAVLCYGQTGSGKTCVLYHSCVPCVSWHLHACVQRECVNQKCLTENRVEHYLCYAVTQ